MIEILTKDLEKLEKLISLGYQNALKSLSTIVQEVAQIKTSPLQLWDVSQKRVFLKASSNNINILTTDIIGQVKGKSFFLLNYEEVDELIKHCKVPNSMKDAFLLEIDNMLAAAVITIFSNYCDLKMYGGVPQINEVEGENLSHFIAKDLENLSNFKGICLVSETHFVFEGNLEITPQFLWFLPEEFVQVVHEKVNLESLN